MDFFEQLEKGRFGSFELKHQVGPNLLKGLLVSLLIHGGVIASPLIYRLLQSEEVVVLSTVGDGRDTVVLVMPPLERQDPDRSEPMLEPPVLSETAETFLNPVEDEPSPDSGKLIATSKELGQHYQDIADSLNGLGGDGGGPVTYIEPPDDPILPPDTFIFVEIQPQPIGTNPQPQFPELARISGLGGTVIVNIWVDKRGDVKQWRVMKTDPKGLGFEEEVLKIVPKWKFTPAIQSGKPIGVWVAVPFRFKLQK